MGLLFGDITEEGYTPSLLFRLLRPRTSGNTINGLGETERRRPTPIYHRYDFWHPWIIEGMTFMARKILTKRHRPFFMRMIELDRQGFVPIAPERVEKTPEAWTEAVKTKALSLAGCEVVGIARLDPEWVFDRDTIDYEYVIMLGLTMDIEQLRKNLEGDSVGGEITVLDTYIRSQEAAFELADWIRAQGHDAVGVGGPKGSALNNIPAAIEAGLGQLGKHGSMMNDELGACFRLAYVPTNLPLVVDEPRDIGVDEFCSQCNLCEKHCPADAIYPTKQMVRGVEKWYVDFDKCVPFFNEHDGCGICISVCPWSRPGIAPSLVKKMLKKQARRIARTGQDTADSPAEQR